MLNGDERTTQGVCPFVAPVRLRTVSVQPYRHVGPCRLEQQIQKLVGFSNEAVPVLQQIQHHVLPKLKGKYCERE